MAADEVRGKTFWEWLKQSASKKETEGMIMTTQKQVLNMNVKSI